MSLSRSLLAVGELGLVGMGTGSRAASLLIPGSAAGGLLLLLLSISWLLFSLATGGRSRTGRAGGGAARLSENKVLMNKILKSRPLLKILHLSLFFLEIS